MFVERVCAELRVCTWLKEDCRLDAGFGLAFDDSGGGLPDLPENTIHQAFDLGQAATPLPWLHIAQEVAREAAARGYRRVGITGTAWLVASEFYPQALEAQGLAWLRPSEAERQAMGRIIMDELVYGRCQADSVATLQAIITSLAARGCDAVVLGCTELPLVLNDGNSALPTLDSTRLPARAALDQAIARTLPGG